MERRTIESADGVTIAVRIYGHLQDSALLICPGLGASHEQWEADAEHFSKIAPCVIVNPRGHGDSGSPENPKKANFTLPVMARDLVETCQQLGLGQIDFLGNSMGGLIGLEMIRQGAPLRSLITCGTTYELHFSAFQVKLKHLAQKLMGKRLPNIVARTSTQNEAGREIIRSMLSNTRQELTKLVDFDIADYNYINDARNFHGRILILRGEHDKAINAEIGSTLDALKDKAGFTLVDVPGAGHFTNLDDPSAFHALVEPFLVDVATAN